AGILIVGKIGEFAPALAVFFGIVEQARDWRVGSRFSELDRGGVPMKIVIAAGQECRQQFVQAGCGPPAVAEGIAATEKENAATGGINILAKQFLLERGEIVGSYRADDDAGVAE